MKKFKKKYSLMIFLSVATVLLSSCGTANDPSDTSAFVPDEKKPVEIRVVTSYGGDDGNRQSYEKAYKAYEANSGNIVKDFSKISNEEWKSGIMSDFESNNEPDVLFYFTGADSNKIVAEEKVVSIDEIRSVYPDYALNMDDDMIPKSPLDGKSYAVPVNGYWEGLYVNKKVLSDCGVEIPDAQTTWEEFLSDCQTIKNSGYVPIAASIYEVPHYWFEFCIFNNSTVENHTVLPVLSSDAAGQRWVAGLNDIKGIFEKRFFPDNTTTAAGVETDVLMTDNKAAFMIDGSWKMGWFAENAADINNFTVTYVPSKENGERKPTDIIGGISMGYFITKKAWDNPEKREVCVEFIKAMTSDEVVATFGVTAITALKNDIPAPANASNLVKDALSMTANITDIVPAAGDMLLPDSRSELFAEIKNIVTGNISAEEAVDGCLKTNS